MKLFIPILCYNHSCNTTFMLCLTKLVFALTNRNVNVTLYPITFESLISRGRNAAVAKFLSEPDATRILFIDSDIEFDPEDVFKLIQSDKDVICAGYAQKWLREDLVQNVFQRKEIPVNPFELCTHTSIQVNTSDEISEILEISYATTGFLLIKRDVFDIMRKTYPERKYINDIDGYMTADKDLFYDFFPAAINPTTKRFESEDFGFSTLWRKCGGKVHLYTNITLKHHGWFGYPSNIYRQLVDNTEKAKTADEKL